MLNHTLSRTTAAHKPQYIHGLLQIHTTGSEYGKAILRQCCPRDETQQEQFELSLNLPPHQITLKTREICRGKYKQVLLWCKTDRNVPLDCVVMAGNLLSLLLLVFLKLGSSSMEQLLACHWEKARKEICMHAVRCTASLLFSNQVLLPQSHSPSARHASRRGDVFIWGACTTCPMSRSIVGQKASENGCRLRHRWWKRESVFLEHFFLLVEWRLWEEGKLILHFGALWSHPDFLLGVDLNSLPYRTVFLTWKRVWRHTLTSLPYLHVLGSVFSYYRTG